MFSLEVQGTPTEHGDINFLETFTFDNGSHFPRSYREFAKQLGYGKTLGQFLIYIPMDEYGDSWNVRTEEIRDTYFEQIENIEDEDDDNFMYSTKPDGSLELMKTWVPFASSENGKYLFWDIREEHNNEFDIYITDFRSGIRKAAKNLHELIDTLSDPKEFKKVLPSSSDPLPRTFQPLQRIE